MLRMVKWMLQLVDKETVTTRRSSNQCTEMNDEERHTTQGGTLHLIFVRKSATPSQCARRNRNIKKNKYITLKRTRHDRWLLGACMRYERTSIMQSYTTTRCVIHAAFHQVMYGWGSRREGRRQEETDVANQKRKEVSEAQFVFGFAAVPFEDDKREFSV